MFEGLVVIRGAGDLGSGTALRLWRCGFRVVLLETEAPIAVRRTVCFSEAVYDKKARVEELEGVRASGPEDALSIAKRGHAAILVDRSATTVSSLSPYAVVDAIMAKDNFGTTRGMAPVTVALGPGFVAGIDVLAVVETNRGPDLGRVIWNGSAEANTGIPNPVAGYTEERVLRAPCSGTVSTLARIGTLVTAGQPLAAVADETIHARFDGVLRGMVRPGLAVRAGMKIGDVDPRTDPRLTSRVSDKSLAVAGGVLEAILVQIKQERL